MVALGGNSGVMYPTAFHTGFHEVLESYSDTLEVSTMDDEEAE